MVFVSHALVSVRGGGGQWSREGRRESYPLYDADRGSVPFDIGRHCSTASCGRHTIQSSGPEVSRGCRSYWAIAEHAEEMQPAHHHPSPACKAA